MKRAYLAWYVVVALLFVAPVGGVLVKKWRTPPPPPVDEAAAVEGKQLFVHEFKANDPLCNGGDGLGPVFNENSCVACHFKGGTGGSGELKHNVTTFTVKHQDKSKTDREGVVHARAVNGKFQERLSHIDGALPTTTQPDLDMCHTVNQMSERLARRFTSNLTTAQSRSSIHLSQRNTPALFGANLIDAIPDRVLIAMERSQRLKWGLASSTSEDAPVGRALRLVDGRVGHFGWKAQAASLSDFVQAACANELGLGNPGQAQPKPLGMPSYEAMGIDLTQEQCDQLTSYIASLPKPDEVTFKEPVLRERAHLGKQLFSTIGCAECHTPSVASVEGIYSDLLLHRMGETLVGGGSYNEPRPLMPASPSAPIEAPLADEWRTPPLWGVADSAPYMHDGRAADLQQAIALHGGQGRTASERFQRLTPNQQTYLVTFLKSLRAPGAEARYREKAVPVALNK